MIPTRYSRPDTLPGTGVASRSEVPPPPASFLGIYAKSPSLQQRQGFAGDGYSPSKARLERFALQSVVKNILPHSRTAKCLRLRHKSSDGSNASIQVWRSAEHSTAHYKGLQTCASVWACPVCSAKISERRRVELAAAIATHKAKGGEVLLLTLTNRHNKRDDLYHLVECQAKALGYFMRGTKAAKVWFDSLGSIGTVRAFEVTHQEANGWHPHYHVLVFAKSGLDLEQLQLNGAKLWIQCCKLAGLDLPSIERGLTLKDGNYAAKYVSKWGLDQEMTKGHQKKAKAGGSSPFDLLRRFLADSKDHRASMLFREFAEVFKGRRQLVWSKGLKALFAVDEKTDEQIADSVTEGSELFGRLDLIQWRQVLRFEKQGLQIRGWLLELAGKGDRFQFDALLDALRVKPERFMS